MASVHIMWRILTFSVCLVAFFTIFCNSETRELFERRKSASSSKEPGILQLPFVYEMTAKDLELSELNRLIHDVGATFYLDQSRDMTIFLPVNSAFEKLGRNLHEYPWEVKWRILQYHIIPQENIKIDEMTVGHEETHYTWEGSPLKVSALGDVHTAEQSTGSDTLEKTTFEERDAHTEKTDGVSAETKQDDVATHKNYRLNESTGIYETRIETFNGPSYKIDQILIPSDIDLSTVEPVKEKNKQINPQVLDQHQRQEARTGNRPRSETTPTFLEKINRQHSRWNRETYIEKPTRSSGVEKTEEKTEGADTPVSDVATSQSVSSGNSTNAQRSTFYEGQNASPQEFGRPIGDVVEGGETNELIGATDIPDQDPSSSKREGDDDDQEGIEIKAAMETPTASERKIEERDIRVEPLSAIGYHPSLPPSVQPDGLTGGLLPEEELITHYWSHGGPAYHTLRSERVTPAYIQSPFEKLNSIIE